MNSTILIMTFKTLQDTAIEGIATTFAESFSDYVVPFKISTEQLNDKIKSDSLKLKLSVGAFDENKLVGFILHGYNVINQQKIIYNGGTGVIPSVRGRQLTGKMYRHILPLLQEKDIDKIILEVITINKPAIKVYESLGFNISRTLDCYKGTIKPLETSAGIDIRSLDYYDWKTMSSFWDWQPSWQNAITAIEQSKQSNISLGVYKNEYLIAYLIFNPKMNRVQQFAVDKQYRNKGIAKQLFAFIGTNYSNEIAIINVDGYSVASNKFIEAIGLDKYVMQYEMEMLLK